MIKIIVEISKYVLLLFMILFTMDTFMVLKKKTKSGQKRLIGRQIVLMILFDCIGFGILYLQTFDQYMLVMLGCVLVYIFVVQCFYRLIYRKASLILLNSMCMMLSVGFLIQTRLGVTTAVKQFFIVAIATAMSFVVPVFVRRVKIVRDLTWFYAILGILLLGAVLALSKLSGGANLSLKIGGITFQFSEFVKITFVFYIAGMLQNSTKFGRVMLATLVAFIHVGILVLSNDLGTALIYFVAYIVMVFVATRNPGYALLGFGGMGGAVYVGYHMFSHFRVRVNAWRNPLADYSGQGYQIAQALFGIVAGGWFGTGLFNGSPESIPVVKEDFTFAAICEEMGVLFAICIVLLCMGMYLLIVNISMKMSKPFYKLIAIGLGTEYAFQVFLTVGGTTKFIPMTGITLPLISYGGSSIMCTILMLAIIQGLYILRKDEDEQFEEQKQRKQSILYEQPGNGYEQQPYEGIQPNEETREMPGQTDELGKRIQKQTEESIRW